MATQLQLDQARQAYHLLQTGQAVSQFVDQNGEQVKYVAANRADLYAYIQKLECELGLGCAPAFRPARFFF